jgi:hypothetical protein
VLTDEGRERLESAGRSHVAQVRGLIEEQLSAEELETLVELLGRLPRRRQRRRAASTAASASAPGPQASASIATCRLASTGRSTRSAFSISRPSERSRPAPA